MILTEIRRATLADAPELSVLMCENARVTLGPHYTQQQMDTFLRYYSVEAIEGKIARQQVFCAMSGNVIAGTIALDGDFVVGFYTRLDFLGKGIGARLLHHLEQVARQQGLTHIRLASSPASNSFYVRHGFAEIETKVFNYLGVDFVETLMEKVM